MIVVGVVVLAGIATAMAVRSLTPRSQAVLRLAPAAAAVDDELMVLVSGSGWAREEDVAICVYSAEDAPCDEDNAVVTIQADRAGGIATDVLAGPLLGQGMTTFVASGLDSGQVATRSFRVLRTADERTGAMLPTAGVDGELLNQKYDPSQVTPTPLAPEAAGDAWRGEYFANPDLAGTPAVVRSDPGLNFQWALGAPDPALPADGFSVRWSRRIPFEGGSYRFVAEANGGLRLTVGDKVVIDQWQDDGTTSVLTAVTELAQGEHDVVVAFSDRQGDALVNLRWETVESFADWRGEYFANPSLAGEPVVVRNDPALDFDWGEASPMPGPIPADEFSVRWTRTLQFAGGSYRFSMIANDGARLLVDNLIVIDAWSGRSDQPVTADMQLTEGDHQISVVFFDNAGPARVIVGWSPIVSTTPDGIAAAPTVAVTPTQPPGIPTPTWTPGSPTGVATPPTQLVETPTPTPTAPPGSTATPTFTTVPGSTATPTATAPPGSGTATPTPTQAPTAEPGSTSTPTPTPTNTVPPILELGLNPAEGRVNQEIMVSVGGQWTPGVTFYVVLLPRGMTTPPPVGQPISILATGTTSTDGSERRVTFSVPDDPQLLGVQPIQLVVYTDGWNQWKVEPFTINTE